MVEFCLKYGLRPTLSYLVDYNCITAAIRNLAHASVGHPAKLEIIGMRKKLQSKKQYAAVFFKDRMI